MHFPEPTPASLRAIACGYDHCLALFEGGIVFSWGDNTEGKLGMGQSMDFPFLIPTLVPLNFLPAEGEKVVSVSASRNSNFFLTNQGDVYVSGYLAFNSSTTKVTPLKVEKIPFKVEKIFCAKACDRVFLLNSSEKKVVSWGR